MNELPIYKIKGKFYFLDKRLCEYRNMNNPSDKLDYNDFSSVLENWTKEDSIKVFGEVE